VRADSGIDAICLVHIVDNELSTAQMHVHPSRIHFRCIVVGAYYSTVTLERTLRLALLPIASGAAL